jgi:hypothetical protein
MDTNLNEDEKKYLNIGKFIILETLNYQEANQLMKSL